MFRRLAWSLTLFVQVACGDPSLFDAPVSGGPMGARRAAVGREALAAADLMRAGALGGVSHSAPVAAADAGIRDGGGSAPAAPTIAERCFADIWRPGVVAPDYDRFGPTIGSHCNGTNHQDIRDVQRVVFLGDSITVGTPPTVPWGVYRAQLARRLSARFGLRAPSVLWQTPNPVTGEALVRSSGDFASCAKWGARATDLNARQLEDCFPAKERYKKTLVVMTVGGNDVAALTRDGVHRSYAQSQAAVESFVGELRRAVRWLKDPANVPGGVSVVFANMYEYTDATGDVASCAAAQLFGFAQRWDRPAELEQLLIWANEQFMSIAVETRSDLVLLLEHFCGHGYRRNDPRSRCYRGPGAELWFDLTCIHPNPTGHQKLADMMMSVIGE